MLVYFKNCWIIQWPLLHARALIMSKPFVVNHIKSISITQLKINTFKYRNALLRHFTLIPINISSIGRDYHDMDIIDHCGKLCICWYYFSVWKDICRKYHSICVLLDGIQMRLLVRGSTQYDHPKKIHFSIREIKEIARAVVKLTSFKNVSFSSRPFPRAEILQGWRRLIGLTSWRREAQQR